MPAHFQNDADRLLSRIDCEDHFRFLDLPPEVRNLIYRQLLTFRGPTYPTNGTPTSVKSQHKDLRQKKRDAIPVPQSALNILCTNQQIHKEAMKLFYQENDLVFSAPETLQPFLSSLGDRRLDSLRSVTLF